jgi:hypothetical protein
VYRDAWIRRRVVTAICWTSSQLITVILWALELLADAWYWLFYAIAAVEAFFIRPYIASWIEDITHTYWMVVTFSYEVWLVLEATILLLS